MNDKPPVARYRLELQVTSNDIHEISKLLDQIATDTYIRTQQGQTTMEIISGAGYILNLTEPNPEMTPERYTEELMAWSGERIRESRKEE